MPIGNGDKKSNAMGVAALVAALAAGGGGVGIVAGGQETAREMDELRADIEEIRALMAAEEARVLAIINEATTASADRTRRVRSEVEAIIDDLDEKVHEMELENARESGHS